MESEVKVELLEILLTNLGSAAHVAPSRQDLTRQAHSRVVQIVEDYTLTHMAERLYLTDLCKAAGVSERTLQYAFKEVRGITPVAYLGTAALASSAGGAAGSVPGFDHGDD